jgi:hypothetical protein
MINKQSVIPINQDEVSHYLKDIRKIKVMTAERERELSALMQSDSVTDKQKESVKKEQHGRGGLSLVSQQAIGSRRTDYSTKTRQVETRTRVSGA